MCGFFVAIAKAGFQLNINECRHAADLIMHRGPDAYGEWISQDKDVFMGFRRLSIVDLSSDANQPMISGDGRFIIVFNGEIYNFKELKQELIAEGVIFKTKSDTEVLLEYFVKHGVAYLNKFEGMFSFAIYDTFKMEFTICRDQFGIKPLYMSKISENTIFFASEVKSFYGISNFKFEFNDGLLDEFLLFRSIVGGRTLFKGVELIDSGTMLFINKNNLSCVSKKYWCHLSEVGNIKQLSFNDAKASYYSEFSNSVKRHLNADVKIGTQFSGGIDSGLISAIARRDFKFNCTGFYCSVQDSFFDEEPFAEGMSKYIGLDYLNTTNFNSDIFFSNLLEKLTWNMDEPLGHPNAMGVYLISKLAKSNCTVLLSGEGADEFFGGYYRYPRITLGNLFRNFPSLCGKLSFLNKCRKFSKINTFAALVEESQSITLDEDIMLGTKFISLDVLYSLFGRKINKDELMLSRKSIFDKIPKSLSPALSAQIFDISTYLPPLLMRQDKMSMAASIENRVPFVTLTSFKLAMQLPQNLRSGFFARKKILHEHFNKYYPKQYSDRQKMGFGIPLGRWFEQSSGKERLASLRDRNSKIYNYIDYKAVNTSIKEFDGSQEKGELMWILLSLNVWLDIFSNKNKVLSFV